MKSILPIDLIKDIKYFCRRQALNLLGKRDFYHNYKGPCSSDDSLILDEVNFSEEELICISEPHVSEKIPDEIKQRAGNFNLPQPYLFEVADAKLLGRYATGFTSNGDLITETAVPRFYGLEQSVSIRTLAQSTLPSLWLPNFDAAFSLVNPWVNNYFHWLIDCLPRLEGIEYYQEKKGYKLRIIIPPVPTSWQKDSLKMLGYPPENCICWNGTGVKVNRLIVPSFRRHSLSELSPAACRWLRERIISSLPPEHSRTSFSPKVIISRRKATGRRVLNEEELMKYLTPLGFVSYVLEELSFLEQVNLFAQAKVVVSPHGAGLVNMIFAHNLAVIELFSSPINPIFFTLSKALEFRYEFVECKTVSRKFNSKRNDMSVDISKLRSALERINA